jgi:hypothetical protein
VVKETIEAAFISDDRTLTTEKLLATIKNTQSISVTLKDKIDAVQKIFQKFDFKVKFENVAEQVCCSATVVREITWL